LELAWLRLEGRGQGIVEVVDDRQRLRPHDHHDLGRDDCQLLHQPTHAGRVGQGRIADRSKEHIGARDLGIVMIRKRLFDDLDAIAKNGSAWVTFSNSHYDPEKGAELYHDYLDQMEFADQLGFDGVCLNEHHQTAYGMMPIPGVLAGALARSVKHAKIAILGRALPLQNNPLNIAEEYAMLDNLTRGRIIAGFVRGIGAEYHASGINPAYSQERFAEAHDLIVRAWTEPGPFAYSGKHYQFRYVNPWPQPTQKPHPPIWVPGARSTETLVNIAKRGYSYFFSSRTHGSETAKAQAQFSKILEEHGKRYDPDRMGILMSAYVSETDAQAKAEAREGVWYFLKNCLKGHLRRGEGRPLTSGPGIPYIPPAEFRNYLKFSDPTAPQLGDAEDWNDIERTQSIDEVLGLGEEWVLERRLRELQCLRLQRRSGSGAGRCPRHNGSRRRRLVTEGLGATHHAVGYNCENVGVALQVRCLCGRDYCGDSVDHVERPDARLASEEKRRFTPEVHCMRRRSIGEPTGSRSGVRLRESRPLAPLRVPRPQRRRRPFHAQSRDVVRN